MKRFALIALATLVVGFAPAALATTVLKVDVPTMTQTSEWVVRAQVHRVTPADLRKEGRGFFTDVELQISEVYRGAKVPARYVLRLIGGEGADGMRMWIPGMPRFAVGDDVVIFLERTSAGHIPCGLSQGVYRVTPDALGDLWVRQAPHSVHLMRRDLHGRLEGVPPRLFTPAQRLDELITEIYGSVAPK